MTRNLSDKYKYFEIFLKVSLAVFLLHMYMFSIYGAKYISLRLKLDMFNLILITLFLAHFV